MIDPLRPDVRDAVENCHESGVNVTMVITQAMARDAGMADSKDQVITGSELKQKTPEGLSESLSHIRVFARASPRQKLEIVNAT